MISQYPTRLGVFARVWVWTLAGIILFVGLIFCLLIIPFVGSFMLFPVKTFNDVVETFFITFVYSLTMGLPLSVVFGGALGLGNGVLMLLLTRQPTGDIFPTYSNRVQQISIFTAVIGAFLLCFVVLEFDVRDVVAPGWLFVALFFVITIFANRWAMRRYLNWHKTKLDFVEYVASRQHLPKFDR